MIRPDTMRTAARLALAAAIAASTLLATGCRERRYGQYLGARDTVTLGAGDAVAHNKAVQTIDPWPRYARDTDLTADGKRMMLGMERYEKNQSLEPEGMGTSQSYDDTRGGPPAAPPPGPAVQ